MSRQAPSQHQRGTSLRELLIIVLLLLTFIVVATEKIWELRVAAERTAVAVMLGNMRSALGIEVARLAAQGRIADIARHDGGDPMLVMRQPHANYRGRISGADPAGIPGYSWYYDVDQGLLVYRVANDEAFETPLEGPARILFRLRLSYQDSNNDGHYQQGIDTIRGLNIVSLHPYRWLTGEAEEE